MQMESSKHSKMANFHQLPINILRSIPVSFSITGLKKGTVFQLDGVPYRVVDYNQKVMGRGGSIVSVRIKSLLDGKVQQRTFKGSEQLDSADVENREVQYLY